MQGEEERPEVSTPASRPANQPPVASGMAGGLDQGLTPYAQAPDGPDDAREPMVASGTAATAEQTTNPKIAALQRNVEKVKGAMNRNINIAMANGEDLEGLQLKSDELRLLSEGFNDSAKKARRKMQWRRIKATAAVVGIGAGCVAAPFLL
eukprot:COSAG05_NODE_5498_length_1158_cov_1.705382_2_plen_151_part_00